MTFGRLVDLKQNANVEEEIILDQNLQVEIDYMTNMQVGRKRKALNEMKIQYQNQLMSLKEKGKRIIMCGKVNNEISDNTN